MTSAIDTKNINVRFPIPGQDNDSQGFRTNFSQIKLALDTASSEISLVQAQKADLVTSNLFTDNTPSVSTVTGAVVVTGGVGIGQDLYVGGSLYVSGGAAISSSTTISSTTTDVIVTGTFGNTSYKIAPTLTGNKTILGTLSVGTVNRSSPTTANLYVATTATDQTGLHIKSSYIDGLGIRLDTHTDDGLNFTYMDFGKTPNNVRSSIATITTDGIALSLNGNIIINGNLSVTGSYPSGTGTNSTSITAGVTSVDGSAGVVSLANLSSFGKALSQNGYQKLPGGLYVQWGFQSITASSMTITFPIQFPTACFTVVPTLYSPNDISGVQSTVAIKSVPTTNSVSLSTPTGQGFGVYWVAYGH